MLISRTTLETICNYKHAASTDPTRLFLNGIYLQNEENGKLKLTATDGHVLITSTHDVTNFSEDIMQSVILSTNDIKTIEHLLKTYKLVNDFNFKLEVSKISISFADNIYYFNAIEREYPNTANIFPSSFAEIETLHLNPTFFEQLRKAVYGSRKPKLPKFKLNFAGELAPITINAKHNEVEHTALLMPIKGE